MFLFYLRTNVDAIIIVRTAKPLYIAWICHIYGQHAKTALGLLLPYVPRRKNTYAVMLLRIHARVELLQLERKFTLIYVSNKYVPLKLNWNYGAVKKTFMNEEGACSWRKNKIYNHRLTWGIALRKMKILRLFDFSCSFDF